MRNAPSCLVCLATVASICWSVGCSGGSSDETVSSSSELLTSAHERAGVATTFHTSGSIDTTNPFFLSLGVNDRACVSCHDGRAAWTITPELAKDLFRESDGTAPLFRPHDGAVRPDADVSTPDARRAAYAMLLSKGLIRFTRTLPATSEFEVTAVDDPYGFSTPAAFSNFRRILPASNLAHASSVTWTGTPGDVRTRLMAVFNGGTKFHAQRTTDVPVEQQAAAADFMLGLYFGQSVDRRAGPLDVDGARGGPRQLSLVPFYIGVNALGGDSQTGAPFDNEALTIFEAWSEDNEPAGRRHETFTDEAREALARGQETFYSLQFDITGVAGLNDALGQPVVRGTCTTCHNTPDAGSNSEFRLTSTGVADAARRTADLPLVTVRNKTSGEVRQLTDLGRGVSSGLWADLGKFKPPGLRGLGSRAPYFHDGSARTVEDIVEFYKVRFGIDFKGTERDLVLFLKAL